MDVCIACTSKKNNSRLKEKGYDKQYYQQHAEQLVRSQLVGQLGQDQMQLLHSLQQLGRKQKEVCKQLPAVLLSHQFTKIVKCWMPIFVLFLK